LGPKIKLGGGGRLASSKKVSQKPEEDSQLLSLGIILGPKINVFIVFTLGGGGRLAGSKKVSQKPEEELPTSLSWNNFRPKNWEGEGD